MTGRDFIIYILQHGLEDEPIFKDGKIVGYLTVYEAAAKMGVGIPTIYTMATLDQLNYILIGETLLILDDDNLKLKS